MLVRELCMGIIYTMLRHCLVVLTAGLLLLAQPDAFASGPTPLTDWEYRWGDAPLAANEPWNSISLPSNPPGRNGQRVVWFKTVLPEGEWRDPVLHITSINLVGQIYHAHLRAWRYGRSTLYRLALAFSGATR